ncbi:flavin reductase [Pigmentiphaga sp.]|uniref:flavin reductase n=1 Tax=Pigmentiphaga sp. TaxID=1977564 RepID=UPI00128CCA56|nr:flavin reductase [Pigmentiphaga sp.]MPS29072.1 FMN reductase [Alcaligenaceae bacterium SAGV5]MPS52220.1 FMN reductase [Alcaligenaceae bacterium SAGV3]MPT57993.1 FMN reductase [Alcaligenaceae bacterium]
MTSLPLAAPRPDGPAYRTAMARLGSSVHIVTSAGPAGRVGLTASAVCSVTDDPPTLLVCLNRRSSAHDAALANGVLCVNTLAAGHETLSRRFSGGGDMSDRFAEGTWSQLETGSPVLENAMAVFDCRIVDTTRQGTHTVMFCEVLDLRTGQAPAGLFYFSRTYHALGATT